MAIRSVDVPPDDENSDPPLPWRCRHCGYCDFMGVSYGERGWVARCHSCGKDTFHTELLGGDRAMSTSPPEPDDDDGDYPEPKLYSWWQVGGYCYTCGWASRIPWIGAWLLSRHNDRLNSSGDRFQ